MESLVEELPPPKFRTPEEDFNGLSRVKKNKNHFADFHPFGIHVYVLDHRLQGNMKIPKWEPRAKVGIY